MADLGAGGGLRLAVVLVLLLLPACSWAEENWVHSGYGSPLASHADFSKIGATCPEGQVVAGVSFQRGGCMEEGIWTQTNQNVLQEGMCEGAEDVDAVQGLYVLLECVPGVVPVFEGTWRAVGVGTPLSRHANFERVGAVCPPAHAVTGIRFDTGGCGLNATSWEEGHLDYSKCTNEPDGRQGLVMELRCSIYDVLMMDTVDWHETGAGYPLETHATFDRVGGHCLADQVATGVAFRAGGYGLGVVTTWQEGEVHSVPDEHPTDDTQGLVLRLNCAQLNTTNIPVASPDPPHPLEQHVLLCSYVPTGSTYPVDRLLFETEAAALMALYTNQVDVKSTTLTQGKVLVSFIVYGTTADCDLLIDLVARQDESVAHTYFSSPSCVVFYYTATPPNQGSTLTLTATPTPSLLPSASIAPSVQPADTAITSASAASDSRGSLQTSWSSGSPQSGGQGESAASSTDRWLLWATIAAAGSSVAGALALLVLLMAVVGTLVALRMRRRGIREEEVDEAMLAVDGV